MLVYAPFNRAEYVRSVYKQTVGGECGIDFLCACWCYLSSSNHTGYLCHVDDDDDAAGENTTINITNQWYVCADWMLPVFGYVQGRILEQEGGESCQNDNIQTNLKSCMDIILDGT